mmetsp:Transcript_37487/g.71813  ORF Transcript_37487/g.71813 Transcript_37487/m.71813 type:complete len:232 (+) Transcript_37487:265-960(+)
MQIRVPCQQHVSLVPRRRLPLNPGRYPLRARVACPPLGHVPTLCLCGAAAGRGRQGMRLTMAVLSSGERVVGGHHVRGRASANCSATHVGHAPRAVEEPPILDLAEHDIGRVLMRDLAVAAGSLIGFDTKACAAPRVCCKILKIMQDIRDESSLLPDRVRFICGLVFRTPRSTPNVCWRNVPSFLRHKERHGCSVYSHPGTFWGTESFTNCAMLLNPKRNICNSLVAPILA